MKIVIASMEHLDAIVAITDQAKASMAASGFDQWQHGYPNRTVWKEDITEKGAYIILDRGHVVGMFRYCAKPETCYSNIDGAWLTDGPYAVIHRCAVDAKFRGRGIIGMLFAFACEKARAEGMVSVRVDTHSNNVPMRRALEKNGFSLCGTVYLTEGVEAGSPRVAYEKVLD